MVAATAKKEDTAQAQVAEAKDATKSRRKRKSVAKATEVAEAKDAKGRRKE